MAFWLQQRIQDRGHGAFHLSPHLRRSSVKGNKVMFLSAKDRYQCRLRETSVTMRSLALCRPLVTPIRTLCLQKISFQGHHQSANVPSIARGSHRHTRKQVSASHHTSSGYSQFSPEAPCLATMRLTVYSRVLTHGPVASPSTCLFCCHPSLLPSA